MHILKNYGKEYFLQNVKSIFEADDLTIANNEGTFTDSSSREDKTSHSKHPHLLQEFTPAVLWKQ